ncbi:MAG: hypothetical protein RMK61_01645 [Bacteroidota bacterium]|nr:hypothetical protein [Bacteroidota bacterium]
MYRNCRRGAFLKWNLPRELILSSIQNIKFVDLKNIEINYHHYEPLAHPKLAPGAFAWAVPIIQNQIRVRLMAEGAVHSLFNIF